MAVNRALVMGPGRSGSRYLSRLLSEELDFYVIHEQTKRFRKGKYVEECDWEEAADWLDEKEFRALSGFCYGWMVHYMRHRIRQLPVICVHRNYESWVKSAGGEKCFEGAKGWPEGAVGAYDFWSMYESLMGSVPAPVLHLKMSELDDCLPKIKELLS